MDERLKILEMVKEGKVSPEQAVELLKAVDHSGNDTILENFVDFEDDKGPAWGLRFTGTSKKGTNTSFVVPLGLIKFFNGLFPNSTIINVNSKNLDRDQLMDRIYAGKRGVLHQEQNSDGSGVTIELV